MRKSMEWILALGAIGVAAILASIQKKRDEEAMAEYVKSVMMHETIMIFSKPRTKF